MTGSDANQIDRSELYGTEGWEERTAAVCRRLSESWRSEEAVRRKERICSLVEITRPATLAGFSVVIVYFSAQ